MTRAGGVRFRIRFDALPWLPGAWQYGEAWIFAGGAHSNHAFFNPLVTYTRPVTDWQEMLLHDPQTSGGLLLAVPDERAESLLNFCVERDQAAWTIGDVAAGEGLEIA
jgi:selenide, water dikinase